MNVEFLENKTGEITAGAYLLSNSIAEIVNSALSKLGVVLYYLLLIIIF